MEVLSLAHLIGRNKLSRCSWTSSVNKRIAWFGQHPTLIELPFQKRIPPSSGTNPCLTSLKVPFFFCTSGSSQVMVVLSWPSSFLLHAVEPV